MLDVNEIRKDFPILAQKINKKDLVYFDNAATTQKPNCVIDAISKVYREFYSNIHRGIHTLAQKSTEEFENVRNITASLINAKAEEIIFTKNATESLNLIAYTFGRKNISENNLILLTEIEHHSNIIPWQLLAKEKKAKLEYIKVTGDGCFENYINYFSLKPKILAMTLVSNVLGTIVDDIAEIINLAHQNNCFVVIDAAQAVPHLQVDVKNLDCDFLAFSAHKMLGPTGVGVLYAKKEIIEDLEPFLGGGEMILNVEKYNATWNEIPWKFEAGTPNVVDVIAFGEAIKYLQKLQYKNIIEYEEFLNSVFLEKLLSKNKIELYGPTNPKKRVATFSFNIKGLHPHDLGSFLDSKGIAIRAGHHCAQVLIKKLNLQATARASLYIYNTKDEIEYFFDVVNDAIKFFGV